MEDDTSKERGLYLREPNDETSQLPIYEDESGTHILLPKMFRLFLIWRTYMRLG